MRCLSFLEIMNKNNQIIIISFSDIYRQQHFYEELKENNLGLYLDRSSRYGRLQLLL